MTQSIKWVTKESPNGLKAYLANIKDASQIDALHYTVEMWAKVFEAQASTSWVGTIVCSIMLHGDSCTFSAGPTDLDAGRRFGSSVILTFQGPDNEWDLPDADDPSFEEKYDEKFLLAKDLLRRAYYHPIVQQLLVTNESSVPVYCDDSGDADTRKRL